ncbi:AHH domain-containing protein [Xenorhabdus bovienii]|nr:AHH domain-containing protein [Xenorhabdus bovienii]
MNYSILSRLIIPNQFPHLQFNLTELLLLALVLLLDGAGVVAVRDQHKVAIHNLDGECTTYASQWLDEENGLVYNRFRYYSPVVGCYLTPDPLGLMGGTNPYRYVHNPTGWVDPLGLAGCSTKLGKNMMEEMGLPRSTTWKGHEAHNVIPKDFSDHPALKAIKYDIDDAANGIFLRRPDRVVNKKIATTVSPMARHRGNHFGYSDAVEKALNKIDLKQPVDAIAKQVADIQIKAKKAMMNGLPIRAKDIVNGDSKLGNKRAFELWDKVFNK